MLDVAYLRFCKGSVSTFHPRVQNGLLGEIFSFLFGVGAAHLRYYLLLLPAIKQLGADASNCRAAA